MAITIITSKAVVMVAGSARLCHGCIRHDGVEDRQSEKHYEQVVSRRNMRYH
jgi:hypothetical protein